MNSHLRRAAAACLFSTVPGWFLLPGSTVLAQSAGQIRHADAFEELFEEPAPRNDLGKAERLPKKEDFSASRKLGTGSSSSSNQKRFKRKSPVKTPTAAPATAAKDPAVPATANHPSSATPVEADVVSQTAALQSRPFSSKKPQTYSSPPQNYSSSSSNGPSSNGDPTTSDVERELQELYRKNGREMPDMRMDDFQPPQTQGAPPRVPGMRHGPTSTSDPNTNQPKIKPSKPNFMERVFGFGRGKKTTPAAAPQPSRPSSQAVAPRNSGVSPSSRPAQQYAPFRPTPVTAPSPTSVPRAASVPAAREPAPIGPTSQSPGIQPPATLPGAQPQRLPGLQPRESMLLDESDLGDDESLDLSQDEPETEPQVATPRAAPAAAPAGSPYTGLTITPNETERSLAHGEELPRPSRSPEPAASPSASSTTDSFAEAPKTESPKPKAPLLEPDASDSHPLPLPAAGPGTKSTADDFLELADEDDDDDDDDLADKAKSESLSLPELDIPAPAEPKALPEEKPANQAPPKATEKAAPAAPPKPPELPTKPAVQKPVEKPVEKPAPSPPESLKGLKGFCPVILKDERRLVEARAQYKLEYRGKTYLFSSQEARLTFETNPTKYVPVEEGRDVVRLAGGNQSDVDGTLEHAAWYRGRLYLFSSEETRREFVETPSRFMRND